MPSLLHFNLDSDWWNTRSHSIWAVIPLNQLLSSLFKGRLLDRLHLPLIAFYQYYDAQGRLNRNRTHKNKLLYPCNSLSSATCLQFWNLFDPNFLTFPWPYVVFCSNQGQAGRWFAKFVSLLRHLAFSFRMLSTQGEFLQQRQFLFVSEANNCFGRSWVWRVSAGKIVACKASVTYLESSRDYQNGKLCSSRIFCCIVSGLRDKSLSCSPSLATKQSCTAPSDCVPNSWKREMQIVRHISLLRILSSFNAFLRDGMLARIQHATAERNL